MSVQDKLLMSHGLSRDSGVKLNNKCDIKYIVLIFVLKKVGS